MAITPEQARAELLRRQKMRQTQEPKEEENLLQKITRYGIKDPLAGVAQMGHQVMNLPHNIVAGLEGRLKELGQPAEQFAQQSGVPTQTTTPQISSSIPRQKEQDFGKELGIEEPTMIDKLIQFGGQYGPSIAIPGMNLGRAGQAIGSIPKVGRFAQRTISEAIPQAGYAAVQAQDDPEKAAIEAGGSMVPLSMISEMLLSKNKTIRNIAKGLAGATGAYVGEEAASGLGIDGLGKAGLAAAGGLLGARFPGSKNELKDKLTEGVSGQMAKERLQMAEQLGLDYLTPAEAGVSPLAAKRQGQLGRTAEGGKLLYEKGQQRIESERKAINSVLDSIYTEERMGPQIKSIYEQVYPTHVPEEMMSDLHDNAVIQKARRQMHTTPAFQEALKDVPEDSLGYWDHVKQVLSDLENKAPDNEARIIGGVRHDLTSRLDEVSPQYARARHLYERKMTRQSLEKVFDRKEITGKNFYQALASQNKFEDLLHHLRDVPQAASNLKAMRTIFKDLMGPPTIRTAKGAEERGMFQARSSGAYLEQLFENIFTKGKHDKEAIEFITSPTWQKQLNKIQKISDKASKLEAFTLLLSKGISQLIGAEGIAEEES